MRMKPDAVQFRNITEEFGIEAEVEMTKHPGWYRSHVKIQGEPLVSILIPNKDHIDDL